MEAEIQSAARGLARILGYGSVLSVEAAGMDEDERGWSGAKLVRGRVRLSNGADVTMIFKLAQRGERCVMKRLTEQGQCSPAAYAPDVDSQTPHWMAMEDLGRQKPPVWDDPLWADRAAEGLASIHAANLARGDEMPWLPRADRDYWRSVTDELSVAHFERKLREDPLFEREFGRYLPRLRDMGRRFADEMTALCEEGTSMTLTHGDLQMRDGMHLYNCGGAARIIDFGFCRYAPFYIDLAGWFDEDNLHQYYRHLSKRGVSVRYADFEERARAAFRYIGFIYLCPSVIDWQHGPTERTGRRLMQSLRIILDGTFPERKRHYSDSLFQDLLHG